MQIKWRNHCKLYKSFDEFYKNKRTKFGLRSKWNKF